MPATDPYSFPGLLWHVGWPAILPLQAVAYQLVGVLADTGRGRKLDAILQLEIWSTSTIVSLGISLATALAIRFRRRFVGSPSAKVAAESLSSAVLAFLILTSRFAVEIGVLIVASTFYMGAGRLEPGPTPLLMPCLSALLTATSIELSRGALTPSIVGSGA